MEGNALLALINRLRTAFVARDELIGPGGSRLVPRSSGVAVFGLDSASVGSAIVMADATTANPFGTTNNFGGLIMLHETAVDGVAALFLCGGFGTTLIAETAAGYYTNTSGTASRINVYYNGTPSLTIENRRGGSRTLNVMAFRGRGGV